MAPLKVSPTAGVSAVNRDLPESTPWQPKSHGASARLAFKAYDDGHLDRRRACLHVPDETRLRLSFPTRAPDPNRPGVFVAGEDIHLHYPGKVDWDDFNRVNGINSWLGSMFRENGLSFKKVEARKHDRLPKHNLKADVYRPGSYTANESRSRSDVDNTAKKLDVPQRQKTDKLPLPPKILDAPREPLAGRAIRVQETASSEIKRSSTTDEIKETLKVHEDRRHIIEEANRLSRIKLSIPSKEADNSHRAHEEVKASIEKLDNAVDARQPLSQRELEETSRVHQGPNSVIKQAKVEATQTEPKAVEQQRTRIEKPRIIVDTLPIKPEPVWVECERDAVLRLAARQLQRRRTLAFTRLANQYNRRHHMCSITHPAGERHITNDGERVLEIDRIAPWRTADSLRASAKEWARFQKMLSDAQMNEPQFNDNGSVIDDSSDEEEMPDPEEPISLSASNLQKSGTKRKADDSWGRDGIKQRKLYERQHIPLDGATLQHDQEDGDNESYDYYTDSGSTPFDGVADWEDEMYDSPADASRQIRRRKRLCRNRTSYDMASVECKVCGTRIKRSDNLLIHYRKVHKLNPPKGAMARTWDPFESMPDAPPQLEIRTSTTAIDEEGDTDDSDFYNNVTNTKKYECQICNKQTSQSFSLKKHYRTAHGLEPPSGLGWNRNWDALKALRDHAHGDAQTSDPTFEEHGTIIDVDYDSGYDIAGFSCKLCVRQVPRIEDLRIHYQTVHGVVPPEERGWVQNWDPRASDQDPKRGPAKVGMSSVKPKTSSKNQTTIPSNPSSRPTPNPPHAETPTPTPTTTEPNVNVTAITKQKRRKQSGTYICRICTKGLTRMHHLRNHYQRIHGITMPIGEEVA